VKSARRKRLNLQQPLSRLVKLKEMNPILKALLKLQYQILVMLIILNEVTISPEKIILRRKKKRVLLYIHPCILYVGSTVRVGAKLKC